MLYINYNKRGENMKYKGRVIIFANKRKYPIVAGYRLHLASKGSNNLMGIHFIDVKESVLNQYTDCIIGTSYEQVDYRVPRKIYRILFSFSLGRLSINSLISSTICSTVLPSVFIT